MASRARRGVGGTGVSIQDVARLAGVATSTVSRALTHPGRITEATRARVIEAANHLGYTANAAARNLRLGRSRIVLVVLPGPPNLGASQVISEMLRTIDTELVRLGYSLVIANMDRRADTEQYILELAFGGVADGAIIFSSNLPSVGGRSLSDGGMPIVSALFDLSPQGIPSVVTNDRQAARDAIRYLIDLGHRDFFYVGGPSDNYHEIERYKGVRGQIARHKDCSLVHCPGQFDFESGTAAAEVYLSSSSRPSAVFCCNDDMALAFVRRVTDEGIKVPEDVSVVGFDGSLVGAYTIPSLSTVEQPTEALGEQVTHVLLRLMENKRRVPLRTVVPSKLLFRDSIAKPRRKNRRGTSKSRSGSNGR